MPVELWRGILMVSIVSPVIKEVLFRSWLVGGKQNVALAFGTISALLALKVFGVKANNIVGSVEMLFIGIAFGYSFHFFFPILNQKRWNNKTLACPLPNKEGLLGKQILYLRNLVLSKNYQNNLNFFFR